MDVQAEVKQIIGEDLSNLGLLVSNKQAEQILKLRESGMEDKAIRTAFEYTYMHTGRLLYSYAMKVAENWLVRGITSEEKAKELVRDEFINSKGVNKLPEKLENLIDTLKKNYGETPDATVNVWFIISALQKLLMEEGKHHTK